MGRSFGRIGRPGKGQGGEGPRPAAVGRALYLDTSTQEEKKTERERRKTDRRYRQCRSNQFSIDLRLCRRRWARARRRALLPETACCSPLHSSMIVVDLVAKPPSLPMPMPISFHSSDGVRRTADGRTNEGSLDGLIARQTDTHPLSPARSAEQAAPPSYLSHTAAGSRSLFEGEAGDHENGTNDDPVELSCPNQNGRRSRHALSGRPAVICRTTPSG